MSERSTARGASSPPLDLRLIRQEATPSLVGVMYFRIVDVGVMEEEEEGRHLDGTILHEMAHVIGFGTLWEVLGLLEDRVDLNNPTGNEDPHFAEDSAIKGFFEVGDAQYSDGEPFRPRTAEGPAR